MAEGNDSTPVGVVQFPSSQRFAGSGVYLLYLRGEIVYVGQGKSMRARIGNHFSEGVKNFDGVSCIPCDVKRMDKVEKALIAALAPKYNQCAIARAVKGECVGASLTLHAQRRGLDPQEAAALLGIDVDELRALGDHGPKRIIGRRPRNRSQFTSYPVLGLIEYMAS